MLEKIIAAIVVFLGMGFALWGLSRRNANVGGCGCGCACSKSCDLPDDDPDGEPKP